MLGGSGWGDKPMPANVKYVGHVYTHDHNAFNCTAQSVLNINRSSMARYGFSPATRVFEAAGAGACIITDAWEGIELFLEPGQEILVAKDGAAMVEQLQSLRPEQARRIGRAAHARVLAEHTYQHRAAQVVRILEGEPAQRDGGMSEGNPPMNETYPAPPAAGSRKPKPVQTTKPLNIVMLGLSITSSWGNGHATTYRALVRALVERGHRVLFLERNVPWYAENRDLPKPPYGCLELYTDLDELKMRFEGPVRTADLVIIGSYVPDGVAVGEWVLATAAGRGGLLRY